MKILVGTSGYGYKEWKGIFYPEKISPKDMLHFYGQHLDAVEINYTFHHMPTERIIAPWGEQVPDDFTFAFKAPQVITHVKRLKDVGDEADYLFKTLSILDRKRGPVLFQFPGSFRVNYQLLEEFLDLIPVRMSCAFEFRSKTWFNDEILDLLRARQFCLCTADTDEKPADGIISTASWGYLRLRRTDYTDADLSRWLERILAQQWERVFVFFKHEEEATGPVVGPELALRFRQLADASPGIQSTSDLR